MKARNIICILAVAMSGCTTDSLLVDQYMPEYSANPFLTDGYCWDVWGEMIGENSAVIFTGRYGLYTEDNFKTYRYNVFGDYENGVPCFGETMFFEGANAWTLYNGGTLSWKLTLGTTTASQAKAIEPYYLRERHESLSFTNIQPPTVLGLNTMIFTAYSDGVLGIYSFIDDEVSLLTELETGLIPVKIFHSNNRFFLLAKTVSPTVQSYVFVSDDATEWSGPFLITTNSSLISYIKELQNLTVALNKNNVFVSNNDGATWNEVDLPIDGEIQDIEVINGNTIYVVIGQQEDKSFGWVSKLATSTDGGNNWQLIDNEFYGENISFYNEQVGIAMSKGVLQSTNDGGINWKLILISNAVK